MIDRCVCRLAQGPLGICFSRPIEYTVDSLGVVEIRGVGAMSSRLDSLADA